MGVKQVFTTQIVSTDQIQRVCTKIQQDGGIIKGTRIKKKIIDLTDSHNRTRWLGTPTEGQAIWICDVGAGKMQLLYRIGTTQEWITLDDGIPAKM
jgi:hypothetical protein